MEAATHCNMLLSWGSRVTCSGPHPSSLTSEFTMTSAVLGACTWVLSTHTVPAAHTNVVNSTIMTLFYTFLLCQETGPSKSYNRTDPMRSTPSPCSGLTHTYTHRKINDCGRSREDKWALVCLNMGAVKSPAITHSDRQTDTNMQPESSPTIPHLKEQKKQNIKLGPDLSLYHPAVHK